MLGHRFNRLVVFARSRHEDAKNVYWDCLCDCGRLTTVATARLNSGHTASCGCLQHESRLERAGKRRNPYVREWRIWYGMIRRCTYPTNVAYPDYGGRGITVCERWRHSFKAFFEDMGLSNGATLDRIDNDGGYAPGNCRWVSQQENNNNRRSNRFIEHGGLRLTVAQWSRRTGVEPWNIRRRLDRGLTTAEVLGTI